jgi:hypothetical protein
MLYPDRRFWVVPIIYGTKYIIHGTNFSSLFKATLSWLSTTYNSLVPPAQSD